MDENRRQATGYLERLDSGDSPAAEQLVPIVYESLRKLARRYLGPGSDQTLQPTVLVHEAYLKLVNEPDRKWNGREHFAAVAARAMRQVMIDHARERKREKRGGDWRKVTLSEIASHAARPNIDVLDLENALQQLEVTSERLCRVAELRLLGGPSVPEIALTLGHVSKTVEGDWTMARAFLVRVLSEAS